jgi:hypothetical protein
MTAQTQAQKVDVTLTDNRPKRHIGLIVTLVIFGIILLGTAAIGWLLLQEGKPVPSVIRGSVLTEKLNLVKKVSEKDGAAVFEHLAELPFGTDMELIDDIRQTINQDGRSYTPCYNYTLPGDRFFECGNNCYIEFTTTDLGINKKGDWCLKVFPVGEAQALPSALKQIILEKMGHDFSFSQDPNIIKRSIVRADLNDDGHDDYAVVMKEYGQDSYNQMSLFCYNPYLNVYYEAINSYNPGAWSIRPFDKGTPVFMESETEIATPIRGLFYEMISSEGLSDSDMAFSKSAIFYDPKVGRFRMFIQSPKSVQEAINQAWESGEEYVAEDVTGESHEDTVQDATEPQTVVADSINVVL